MSRVSSLAGVLNRGLGRSRPALALKAALRTQAPGLFNYLTGREAPRSPFHPAELDYVRLFNPTAEETAWNHQLDQEFELSQEPLGSINWYLPRFDNSLYAGVYTILRFANRLQEAHGIENRIVIFDQPDPTDPVPRREINKAFPALKSIVRLDPERPDEVPAADASVATFWKSAYWVSRVHSTRAKFYFIQDYEPGFYEAGTTSALADATYRFGFRRIVNTPGLLKVLCEEHGGEGTAFIPTVDRTIFSLGEQDQDKGPIRIFFYARPNHPRNGFFLGLEALRQLKERHGRGIEIITAGDDWEPRAYGLDQVVNNLGRISSLTEVAALYRKCHIGLVMMFTRHPSYQPFELMAAGCCVVTNRNRATEWWLKHGENCLIAEPSVNSLSHAMDTLIGNESLRSSLRKNARGTLSVRSWDEVIDEAAINSRLLPIRKRST